MANYSFNRFNPRDFEHMIQALSKSIFGNGSIIFGDGPDGGREATFEGECDFPNAADRWGGYWIIQAKYKAKLEEEKDFSWIKSQFEKEMAGFKKRKDKGIRVPDNYIFFTNVNITGVEGIGIRDKLDDLANDFNDLIENIVFFGESDLCRFLDNNREVATAYSSFILPGDILKSLYDLLNKSKTTDYSLISRYLEKEFKGDLVSRLEHAGNLTDKTINLDKVFIDLYATKDGLLDENIARSEQRLLEKIINIGDEAHRMHFETQLRDTDEEKNKYVIIGGPGYGKSTLTQFLCQVHRASLIKTMANNVSSEVNSFLQECETTEIKMPKCIRFPIKISLKDYAGWIVTRMKEDASSSVISYIQYMFQKKGDGEIELDSIRDILNSISFLFIFDGLDEVPITSNRSAVLDEINSFIDIELRQRNCDAIIIATTRPQGYTKEFDHTKYQHLQLTNLTKSDCSVYLDKLLEMMEPSVDNKEKYINLLRTALDDEVISGLMKTPLQATIMAYLVKSGGEPPRDRYNLFNEYYKTIFKREMQKGVVKVLNDYPKEVDSIHNKLGFFLQASAEGQDSPSSCISIEDFRTFAKQQLEELELDDQIIGVYVDEISFAIVERLVFITEVEDGKVGFSIRSLQEFFAAQFLMHNKTDEYIARTLHLLSGNAYWRNTFLFCVGYLYRHKDFLIDIIDSLCGELNGSSDDYEDISGKSVGKIGSWLALDILNEGTFRGVPKYENKFAKHLEPLFKITACELHSNLGYVSIDIKRKYLKRLVEKYTKSSNMNEKRTALIIGVNLLKHKFYEITEVIDDCFHERFDSELLSRIYKSGVEDNEWLIHKFRMMINDERIAVLPNGFHKLEFIEILIKNDIDNIPVRKFGLESLLISALQQYTRQEVKIVHLINSIVDQKFRLEDDIIFNKNIITYELNNSSQLYLNSIDKTSANVKKIVNICNAYGLTTFKYLFEFIDAPNKQTLSSLFCQLKDESDEMIQTISSISNKINWVFGRIFISNSGLSVYETNAKNGIYGDIEEWRSYEELFRTSSISLDKLLEIYPYKTFDFNAALGGLKQDDFLNYYSLYRTVNKNNRVQLNEELLLRLFFAFDLDFSSIKNELNGEMLNDVFDVLTNNQNEDLDFLIIMLWCYLLDYYSVYELHQSISNKQISFDNINIFEEFLPLRNQKLIQESFDKVAQLIAFIQIESSIIRMLAILCGSTLEKYIVKLDKIDYKYLFSTEYSNSINELSRLLVCFTNQDMEYDIGKALFNKLILLCNNDTKIFNLLLGIIKKYWENNLHKEKILVMIYSRIKLLFGSDYELMLQYENTIRNLCQSYSTDLSITNGN